MKFSRLKYLELQEYERYLPTAFDESLTLLEKMNKLIKGYNLVVDSFNELTEYTENLIKEMEDLLYRIENEILPENILNIMNQWYADGKFDVIIEKVINERFDKYDDDMNNLLNQMSAFETSVNNKITIFENNVNNKIDGIEDTVNAVESNIIKSYGVCTPAHYGAIGDGVSDDTDALQRMFDSECRHIVMSSQNTYLISKPLKMGTGHGYRTVSGKGNIRATKKMTHMLLVDSPSVKISDISLYGVYNAEKGIIIKSNNCEITNVAISGFKTEAPSTTYACGILVQNEGGGVLIDGCRIKDINSTGDGILGNSLGASRGILIDGDDDVPVSAHYVVRNNWISGIIGEEGDGIQVLMFDGTYPFKRANCIIKNNTIVSFSRRGIKIQGSYCDVSSNYINSIIFTATGAFGINVITSNYVDVTNNTVKTTHNMGGISISGSLSNGVVQRARWCTVKNNIIHDYTGDTVSIFINRCNAIDITSNSIFKAFRGVAIGESNFVTVCNNTFVEGRNKDGNAMNVTSNSSRVVFSNNVSTYGDWLYMVECQANNAVIMNNVMFGSGLVRSGNVTDNLVYGNVSGGTSQAVIGAGNDVMVSHNFNTNKSGAGKTIWRASSPTTGTHARGDICFNTGTSTTIVGWRCTGGGTPGTWVTF